MRKIATALFYLFIMSSGLLAQVKSPADISGKWTGILTIQNTKLHIVFNFKQENGIISATLDSPDQGAKGIPVKETVIKNDSILVDVASIMGKYKAVFKSDTSMDGIWIQGPLNLPLIVYKGDNRIKSTAEINNPLYDSKDVKIYSEKAGVTLAGTLTIPKNAKNCPAVILVSGSGAQNRDEELMGQKPFLRIADYLSSHGIAVLRYDDRGVGESTGDYQMATSFDFANDAEAAFSFLQKQDGINSKNTGIIGHSEGGMIAPIVASKNKNVSFIILLAGIGITGKEILLTQTEAILKDQGLNQDTINLIVELNNEMYNLLESHQPDSTIILQSKALIDKRDLPEQAKKVIQNRFVSTLNPWFKGFVVFDPIKYLNQVQCPVLALNGSNDLQVLPKENLSGIEKALKLAKNKKSEIKELPGYNHLFQKVDKGSISEYADLAKPAMDDVVLKIISDWIQK